MTRQDFINRHLLNRSILSIILYPISVINQTIQKFRRDWYHHHQSKKADVKIISIGNITAGGSGKTPFTIWLARHLKQQGKKIAVSHRGYKGDFENNNTLISDRENILSTARKAGDEAQLLAEKLPGIPVCAGKDRWISIQMLCEAYPDLDMIILDDSFQHLKVKHDIDIVIFKTANPVGNGFLLPAGILREPLSAINDADLIIFNGEGEIPQSFQKYDKTIRQGNYRVEGIYLNNQSIIEVSELKSKKLGVISGIADPLSLEKTISNLNLEWQFHLKFPDHYHFAKDSDIRLIKNQIESSQIKFILTTEKDYTKLKHLDLSVPIAVIRIEFYLTDISDLL
ncbi:MAG: tetraacyldisaccharide 4'-kinase [Candidatus Stygibacter frigidus]|nr:tetraacyldisaccharide 4'-kinase [Candidatus Stygibacter frigidus]